MSAQRKQIANDYTPDGKKLSSRHLAYIPNGNGGNRRITSVGQLQWKKRPASRN